MVMNPVPEVNGSFWSGARSVWTAVLFVGGLVVSVLFTLPLMILQQVFPNRSPHHQDRYGFDIPGRIGMIALDSLCLCATYILADVLRCHYRMNTTWPEQIAGYGSTLDIHMKMMAVLAVAWPLILHWLGWYKPRWRSWLWKARSTIAATVLLGLTMAALSLLVDRERYPRSQIAFVAALLPLTTAAILVIRAMLVRAIHPRGSESSLSTEW